MTVIAASSEGVALRKPGLGCAQIVQRPITPAATLADAIPPERTGVYMGIFNIFIVIPMLIEALVIPLVYRPLLGGDARNILYLAGALMIAAAVATLAVGRTRPEGVST